MGRGCPLGLRRKHSASVAPKMSLPILIPEPKSISPYLAKGTLQNLRGDGHRFWGVGWGCDHRESEESEKEIYVNRSRDTRVMRLWP